MRYNKYLLGYNQYIVHNGERNWVISRLAREGYRRGYYVIVLLKRLEHLKLVSEMMGNVPHKIVAGVDYQGEKFVEKKGKLIRKVIGPKIEVSQRQKTTRRFEAGEVKVILANDVFKTGVNIKRVDVIIDGAAQKSKDDAIQKFGRGVRLHPDKTGLLYFDLADQDAYNKRNWFTKAAKSRKRAFMLAGLTTKDFAWKDDAGKCYDFAEKVLKKETENRESS